ncbi:phage N-6-adenine-methyltransferase [Serratia fonticola]
MKDFSATPYVQALNALKSAPTHELKEIGDQWRTPDPLFWGINAMFGPLVLDLFSDGENSKCAAYYTAEDNALVQDWSARLKELNGAAFGNPPYSTAKQYEGEYITGMRHIMRHTAEMREAGGRYVFFIKSATSEVWWPEEADHIAFVRGRISFDLPHWYRPKDAKQEASSAGFGAAIAVFDKSWHGPSQSYISRDQLQAHGEAFLAQIRREVERLAPQVQPQNIPGIIPETANTVWPQEVNFLFGKVADANSLPAHLQQKLRFHINRLKLDAYSDVSIIEAATALAIGMGATA